MTLIRLSEGESLQAVERVDASLDDEDEQAVVRDGEAPLADEAGPQA